MLLLLGWLAYDHFNEAWLSLFLVRVLNLGNDFYGNWLSGLSFSRGRLVCWLWGWSYDFSFLVILGFLGVLSFLGAFSSSFVICLSMAFAINALDLLAVTIFAVNFFLDFMLYWYSVLASFD